MHPSNSTHDLTNHLLFNHFKPQSQNSQSCHFWLCNWWGETWASWSLNLKHVTPSQSSLNTYIIAKKGKNKNKSLFVFVNTNWGQIAQLWETFHIYSIGSKQKYKGFLSFFLVSLLSQMITNTPSSQIWGKQYSKFTLTFIKSLSIHVQHWYLNIL